MKEWTEQQKQKLARFQEILDTGKQRCVAAGGNPQQYRAGFSSKDYLTDAEREEAAQIIQQMLGTTVKDSQGGYQPRSWKLPNNYPLL